MTVFDITIKAEVVDEGHRLEGHLAVYRGDEKVGTVGYAYATGMTAEQVADDLARDLVWHLDRLINPEPS